MRLSCNKLAEQIKIVAKVINCDFKTTGYLMVGPFEKGPFAGAKINGDADFADRTGWVGAECGLRRVEFLSEEILQLLEALGIRKTRN